MRKNFWISLVLLVVFAASAKAVTVPPPCTNKSFDKVYVIHDYDTRRSYWRTFTDRNGCRTLVVVKAKRARVKRTMWTPWDNNPPVQPSRPVKRKVVPRPTPKPVIVNNPYVKD